MKLESLAIRNFRGIGPADGVKFPDRDPNLKAIDLTSDSIFIVGPNNAGKSSILHAYDFFVSSKKSASIEDFFGKNVDNQILIEAKIRAQPDELEDDQTRRWFQNNVATVRKIWNAVGSPGEKYTYDPGDADWKQGGFGGLDTILQNRCPDPIWIQGFTNPNEIIEQLQTLVREAVLEHLSQKDEYAAAEESIKILKEIIEGDDYVTELSEKISGSIKDFFPDAQMTIVNPTSDKGIAPLFDKQAMVQISAQQSPKLSFDRHGHGLQRQLVLSALQGAASEISHLKLTKAQRQKTPVDVARPRIFLIEEPELFLSPPSIRIMKRLIKKIAAIEGFQVMAASHSPVMVDLGAERQTIVRVAKSGGSSSYEQINSQFFDLDARRTLRAINMFNNYNSECIFFEHVIVVEGLGELTAFQTLADRLYKEKDCTVLLRSHIIQFGGKTEIPLIQRILRHLKIPYLVIHDLDDGPDPLEWKKNLEIGEEVLLAKAAGLDACRVALCPDFDRAHGIKIKQDKEKPLKSFEYANRIDLDGDLEQVPIGWIYSKIRDHKLGDLDISNADLEKLRLVTAAIPRLS